MILHPPILFIGDRPNPRRNVVLDVPFVGCPSYKTLLEWIYRMDVDIHWVSIINAYNKHGNLIVPAPFNPASLETRKVILLGSSAAAAWDTWWTGSSNPPKAFKLPHPSGLNRELNNKKELSRLLSRCRAFIYKR